jgi:hypothetical protein
MEPIAAFAPCPDEPGDDEHFDVLRNRLSRREDSVFGRES